MQRFALALSSSRVVKTGVTGVLLACALTLFGARARASAEAVHFVYEAAPSCPSEREFVSSVLARTQKAVLVEASQAERIFAIRIKANNAGFSGLLAIHKGAEETTRDVSGVTCAGVASALALVTALAIDPDSLRSAAPAPPPAVPPPAVVPAQAPPVIPETRPASIERWQWRSGARAELGQFVAPRLPLGAGAFLELGQGGERTSGLDVWSVRASMHYAATGTVQRAAGAAHFNWAALRLESCVLRLRLASTASLDACAAVDFGALHGSGEVAQPAAPLRPWFSVEPLVRLPWFFSGPVFLEAEAALILPLRRETFVFEPRTVYYEVAPAGPAVAFGLGYGFP